MKINLKPKKLDDSQIDRLANITSDLGVVMFAAVVLPTILGKLELLPGIYGVIFTLLFFSASLKLEKIAFYY